MSFSRTYPVHPFLNTALASIDISPSALSQQLRRATVFGQDIDAIAKEDETVRMRPDGCEHGLNPAGYFVLLRRRESLEIDVDLPPLIRIGTTRVSEADLYSSPHFWHANWISCYLVEPRSRPSPTDRQTS